MNDFSSVLADQRVIAIVREHDAKTAVAQVRKLADAGLRIIEISLVTPGALEAIEELNDELPGTFLGAGTVMCVRDVAAAAAAGAKYVVSPILSRGVLRACAERGLPSFPGVATPTEAHSAMRWGARAAKLFPATLWTPAALKDLRAAMPSLPTVPTGGVTPANAGEWISAGAVAVGVGGALTRSAEVEKTVRALLEATRAARP
jgi:2-dehydro-3-deoxyphosphogluconate aldolase / (4S)-4-hydroxy-2-oxoglutarate aldolase